MTKKPPPAQNVVDLEAKRDEKVLEKLRSLIQESEAMLDEQVKLIVAAYRQWEQAHPENAIRPKHKLAMVRLGFVGPAGFTRCHEPHRLPAAAFYDDEGDGDDVLLSDDEGSKKRMCPAMESGTCQGVWRGMGMPACYLLLLEVHQGVAEGESDDSVQEVLDDWGNWEGPEMNADSFARAEQLRRRYE